VFNPWFVFNLWFNLFRAIVFAPWLFPCTRHSWRGERRGGSRVIGCAFQRALANKASHPQKLSEASHPQKLNEANHPQKLNKPCHTRKLWSDSQNLYVCSPTQSAAPLHLTRTVVLHGHVIERPGLQQLPAPKELPRMLNQKSKKNVRPCAGRGNRISRSNP
jgi:hypothetical protein